MKTHLIKAMVLGAGMVVLSSSMEPVVAANINTSGTVCRNFNAGQVTDIDYFANGVRNINASSRFVICPVPRSPLVGGAASASFFVDGRNTGGATTSCTLNTYNFNGTFLGSMSFSANTATYSRTLTVPAAQMPFFGYATVMCSLPGNGNGVVFGVTSQQ